MINTKGTLTILLGKRQVATGERWSLRHLAQVADVPKDLVYRLDAGAARYVELEALDRLCAALHCLPDAILAWDNGSETERA